MIAALEERDSETRLVGQERQVRLIEVSLVKSCTRALSLDLMAVLGEVSVALEIEVGIARTDTARRHRKYRIYSFMLFLIVSY